MQILILHKESLMLQDAAALYLFAQSFEVPSISGLGAEETWVVETEIRLVIRSTQLGGKETSTFYRN